MKYIFICTVLISTRIFAQEYVNELSPEEELAGYELLFNGENLDDWHGYRDEPINNKWNVLTDAPLGPRMAVGPGGWDPILTNKTFTNMDLKIEYLTPPATNSGIFLRYEEEASSAWNTRSGPEFQICSPGDEDCTRSKRSNGACYDMFAVKEDIRNTWFSTPGEWNLVRILYYDSNYVHYGNGKKLLEYKIGTSEFMDAYNRSKYRNDGNGGNYYDIHPGSVLLQNHGEKARVCFRNIRGKELKIHPFRQEFPDGEWPDELPLDFVFGKRGCTNPASGNYDEEAEVDDGSCLNVGTGDTPAAGPWFRADLRITGPELTVTLKDKGPHTVTVLDMTGRTLVEEIGTGRESYTFTTLKRNSIYLVKIRTAKHEAVRRVILL